MAKRFTDSEKWKRGWFEALPVLAKLVWFYVLDNCDHAGVWPMNFRLLSYQVGAEVSRDQFESWFKDKAKLFEGDKYFIPSFVDFQYGKLNPSNNAHLSVIKIIDKIRENEDLMSPSRGAQDKDQDKEKDKDQEKEKGGVGEKTNSPTQASVTKCGHAWAESLRELGIHRDTARTEEEMEIYRAIKLHGEETVYLALTGARYQKKTKEWDPKDYPSIVRIIGKDKNGVCKISQYADLALARQKPPDDSKSVELKEYDRQIAEIQVRLKNGS